MTLAKLQTAFLALVGAVLFWLLYESYVAHDLVAGVLGGLLLIGLVATVSAWNLGAKRPSVTAWLLCGWSLALNVIGVGAATLSVYLLAEIGHHVGGPNNVATRAVASGLGIVWGVLLKLGYDILSNNGYGNFAKFMIGVQYGNDFKLQNEPKARSTKFTAGHSAIYDDGGRIFFPAAWQLTGQASTPDNGDLASLPFDEWKRAAVRTRLMVIRKARDGNSADVTKPDRKVLAEFSDAVVNVLPLLGLGSDLELQKSLAQLKQVGTAANEATAQAVLKQTLTRLQGSLPSVDPQASSQPTGQAAQAAAPSS